MERAPLPASIGPYRVVGLLGQGGMGVVYEARHATTEQRVALKTVLVPRSVLVAAIRREIRALARLHHPDVVAIVGEGLEGGVPWYAMELLEGRTLRELLREGAARRGGDPDAVTYASPAGPGASSWWTTAFVEAVTEVAGAPAAAAAAPRIDAPALDVATAVAIVRQLCLPLAHLHGEGIVHRDLKPENVLMRPDGRPALLDLGTMASFSAMGERETLQRAGDVTGTVFYMSPEQTQGELVDARSDLYALGCILHELLTGSPPFTGTPLEILGQHRNRAPEPPSRRVAGVPAELDAVVARMLAKRPRDRPGHALAVAHALQPFAAGGDAAPREQESAASTRRATCLYRPTLRGRGPVMAALDRHLAEAQEGQGRLVALVAEGGMGKTMAAMALAQVAIRRGIDVRLCACRRVGAEPSSLLPQILEPVVDACREGGAAAARRLLGAQRDIVATIRSEVFELPGCEDARRLPPPDGARLNDALRDVWRAFAGSTRLWILDDVHLADDASLEMLLHLVRSDALVDLPVLVLVTCRPPRDAPLLSRLLARSAQAIDLPPLGDEELQAIGAEMLALPEPAASLAGLALRSSGSPSLLAEHLRLAVDEGLLRQRLDGTWEAPGGEEWPRELPATLDDLVGRRVARLAERESLVAAACAVLGEGIDAASAAHVAGIPEEECIDAIDLLCREGIVEASEGASFRFLRAEAVDAIQARLDPARLRVLHRRAAARIEAEPRPERRLAALARHHLLAGDLDRARPLLRDAVERAFGSFSNDAAERLLRLYLGVVEAGSVEEAWARLRLGGTILANRAPKEAVVELERAVEVASTVGAGLVEARASVRLGEVLDEIGRPGPARAALERGIARARALGDASILAPGLARLGTLLAADGGPDAARPAQDEALSHLDALDDAVAGRVLSGIAYTRQAAGDIQGARALQERALVRYRRAGDARAEAGARSRLGGLFMVERRLDEARPLLQGALESYAALGDRDGEAGALMNLGAFYGELGLLDEALRHCEAAERLARQLGAAALHGTSLFNLAVAKQEAGDRDGAAPVFEEALSVARGIPSLRLEGLALSALAGLRLDAGEPEEALRIYEAALVFTRTIGDAEQEARCLVGAARSASRAGAPAGARAHAERALEIARGCADVVHELGALIELVKLGDDADAAQGLARVRAFAREKGLDRAKSCREDVESLERWVQERARGNGPGESAGD